MRNPKDRPVISQLIKVFCDSSREVRSRLFGIYGVLIAIIGREADWYDCGSHPYQHNHRPTQAKSGNRLCPLVVIMPNSLVRRATLRPQWLHRRQSSVRQRSIEDLHQQHLHTATTMPPPDVESEGWQLSFAGYGRLHADVIPVARREIAERSPDGAPSGHIVQSLPPRPISLQMAESPRW